MRCLASLEYGHVSAQRSGVVRGTRLRLGSQHASRIAHAPSPVLPFTTVYPAYLRKVLMGTPREDFSDIGGYNGLK
jgi:hypothetical protein